MKKIFSSSFDFSPFNDGEKNRIELQKMLDIGGYIIIDKPGIYDVLGTVFIGSNTILKFTERAYIRRISSEDGNDSFILNKGALTHSYDKHIMILGLNLICNNVDITKPKIYGMFCHVGLFYTKHTLIKDFECLDVTPHGFCLQICTFEDSIIENVHIEGRKDAVHYGPGKHFILRNGVFRTFDDPIALNANDYAVANPQMGWIEDGIIENCCDLNQKTTTGYFCRLLGGSWGDWNPGMIIRNSDTVVSNNRMYRAFMPADGKEYISTTPPTHTSGCEELDGIKWVMTQDDNIIYNCGCRNIHFNRILLKKNRPCAFSFHFDNDVHSHSYYPYSIPPVQTNITFTNISIRADVPYLIRSTTPVGDISIINTTLDNTSIRFADRGVEGLSYPITNLSLSNIKVSGKCNISAVEGRKLILSQMNTTILEDSTLDLIGDIECK